MGLFRSIGRLYVLSVGFSYGVLYANTKHEHPELFQFNQPIRSNRNLNDLHRDVKDNCDKLNEYQKQILVDKWIDATFWPVKFIR